MRLEYALVLFANRKRPASTVLMLELGYECYGDVTSAILSACTTQVAVDSRSRH